MPNNNFILCHPLLISPSIIPSMRVFSSESVLHIRWPKYWSFSISISPSNEYSGLISFRMDRLDLLAVQGTLKSLLQQFKSINYLALSFLYSSNLTSIKGSKMSPSWAPGAIRNPWSWDFPGGLVAKTPRSQCRTHRFNPCSGN